MAQDFSNKVVVVTGGTSGIGLATAKAFADAGASVFITGRRQGALDAAVKSIGGRITGVRGDMSNLADIDRLYDAVQQQHSQIDVLFANAGGGEFAPLGAISEDHYASTFDTNVKGDRSGRARHGERGPRHKHRRLQSPSGRRCRAPPHCRT